MNAPAPPGRAAGDLVRCVGHTVALLARHRVRQPRTNAGRHLWFADGTSAIVYRETVIEGAPVRRPAVLVVEFRLRHVRRPWAHRAFRAESELNTILFAGFPGLVSKLWLHHDQEHRYRGFYQWDGPDLAESYARSLWWVLRLVSEPTSIHHVVLPGFLRDDVLQDPSLLDGSTPLPPGGWWRPVLGPGVPSA